MMSVTVATQRVIVGGHSSAVTDEYFKLAPSLVRLDPPRQERSRPVCQRELREPQPELSFTVT